MTATLIGYRRSIQDVQGVKSPEFTKSWAPISHGLLLEMLHDRLAAHNMIVDEATNEFALAKKDKQMFAVFNLRSDARKDFALSLGVRNSIDKSLAAGICCGSRVMVCSNLSFSSEIVFTHRHNANIVDAMPGIIDQALSKFNDDGKAQEALFERMKKVEIPLEMAIDAIVDMGEKHKYLPMPQLHRVIKEYMNPRFTEFAQAGRTAWTLLNACTTFCQHDRGEIDPGKAQANLLGISKHIVDRFALAN